MSKKVLKMGYKGGIFLHIENANELQYDSYELQCELHELQGVRHD